MFEFSKRGLITTGTLQSTLLSLRRLKPSCASLENPSLLGPLLIMYVSCVCSKAKADKRAAKTGMNLYQGSKLVDDSKRQQQYEENFMRVNPLSAIIGAGRTKTKDGKSALLFPHKCRLTAHFAVGSASRQHRLLFRQLAHSQWCKPYPVVWSSIWSHRTVSPNVRSSGVVLTKVVCSNGIGKTSLLRQIAFREVSAASAIGSSGSLTMSLRSLCRTSNGSARRAGRKFTSHLL